MRLYLLLGLLGILYGCASSPTIPQMVPVPVKCAAKMPTRPVMPSESIPKDFNLDTFIQYITAEIERREAYEMELRVELEICL